jgi:hypothetical protein
MLTIAKIIIGIASGLIVLLAIMGVIMGGIFAGMFSPALASLMTIMPLILFAFSLLGFWSIIKNNRTGQFVFAIFLSLGWPAGTVLGVVTLVLLVMGNRSAEASLAKAR